MPAKLNIEKARPREGYEIREERSPQDQQRLGTQRTASEPRGPPRRSNTTQNRPPRSRRGDDDEEYGEVYDMYSSPRGSQGGRRRQQAKYIEEEEEDASDYDDEFDEGDFEMVSNGRSAPRSTRAPSARGGSRKPEIRKVRVKVHSEDVRYIMIGTAIEFPDFVDKIRDKFGLRKRFKIKVRDDDVPNGDMITMGDQDDLEMVLMTVKSNAKKERLDMGKLEVGSLIPCPISWVLTRKIDLDTRSLESHITTRFPLRMISHLCLYPSSVYGIQCI
jgi:hypothetical protein